MDTEFPGYQWHYGTDGARLPHAWSFSRGKGVTLSVVDTGVTNHPDLNAVPVYNPPEGDHRAGEYLIHYDVRAHSGLGAVDQVVLSYNVNTTAVSIGCRSLNDHDPSIYRPRFINVPMQLLLPTNARPVVNSSPASAPAAEVAAGPDYRWYDSWAYPGHCPPLTKSTNLTASSTSDGQVALKWSDYGRDMWYWLESRDATLATGWKRNALWMTGPSFYTNPVTSTQLNGHRFEYRVVPFSSGSSSRDAPTSNVASLVVTVARPAAPTNVSASVPSPKNGTATVRWAGVTSPSAHNYYRVHYWDVTAGESEVGAHALAPTDEQARAVTLNLVPGHSYGFDVQALNIAGDGPRSANASAVP